MRVEELMNLHYDRFTENDRYICAMILQHKQACMKLSIEEFANMFHISTSSLSRFAQKLSLPGYSELKVILRFEQEEHVLQMIDVKQMMQGYDRVIQDMEQKDHTTLFHHITQAKRIILFGDGYAQGRVAKEMKRIFLPTGKKFYDVYGVDMVDTLQNFVEIDDIVIFISLDGETKEVNAYAKQLKMRNVYTISITSMISNSLSHICDENLYIPVARWAVNERSEYKVTTPYFILIELLYVKYTMYIAQDS